VLAISIAAEQNLPSAGQHSHQLPLKFSSLRRSDLSIASGQWKDGDSVGVTCSLMANARVDRYPSIPSERSQTKVQTLSSNLQQVTPTE
jgi:hypothetical protein